MRSKGSGDGIGKDIYILTVHDDTVYDALASDDQPRGPYFEVAKTSYTQDHSDAYTLDIGYNTNTLVTSFAINQNENYALYYDYQQQLSPREYVRRINSKGQ